MQYSKKQWIDIVKGIGIFSIVIGHITDGVLREILFLFHVPLFFFLSGYLFKQPQELKGFIVKKSKTLILPYICFLTVFVLLLLLKDWLKTEEINTEIIYNALKGGQALTGELSVFWFITCLYFTQVIFALIASVSNKSALAVSMLIFLLFAYLAEAYMQGRSFLWAINTIFYALPFYYAGFLYRQLNSSITLSFNLFSFMYVCLFIVAFTINADLFYVDIKHSDFGVPIISFLVSTCVTVILFLTAKKVCLTTWLAKPLSVLGSISMTVMYMHQPIQITLKHGLQLTNELYLVFVTIILCVICHYLLSCTRLTRQYFLGGH